MPYVVDHVPYHGSIEFIGHKTVQRRNTEAAHDKDLTVEHMQHLPSQGLEVDMDWNSHKPKWMLHP